MDPEISFTMGKRAIFPIKMGKEGPECWRGTDIRIFMKSRGRDEGQFANLMVIIIVNSYRFFFCFFFFCYYYYYVPFVYIHEITHLTSSFTLPLLPLHVMSVILTVSLGRKVSVDDLVPPTSVSCTHNEGPIPSTHVHARIRTSLLASERA